jgi:hypothetical protein
MADQKRLQQKNQAGRPELIPPITLAGVVGDINE